MGTSLQLFILIVYGLGSSLSQSLMSVGGTLCTLWALFYSVRTWNRFTRGEKVFISVLWAWVLFSIGNLLLRPWDERSLGTLKDLPYLGILALALWREKKRSGFLILQICTLAQLSSLLLTLYQWFILRFPGGGFFGNSAYFGYNQFFALLGFGEYLWAQKARDPSRAWAWGGFATALLSLALSETRYVWFLAALYIVARMFPLLWRQWGPKKLLLLVGGLTVLGVALYFFEPRIREKVGRTFAAQDLSRTWRLKAWAHNWELFQSSPLVGVGPERNYIDTARDTNLAGHWDPGHAIYAHSIYFQSLADNGLVGTALLLVSLALLAWRVPHLRIYLLFFALAGVMENIFNNSKVAHAFFFYAIILNFWLRRERPHG